MRNPEYKDDQKVFEYINGADCQTYSDLTDFLVRNKLPIRERWAFYFFGKNNWINSDTIAQMEDKSYDSYGGYIDGNIYYWTEHLKTEQEERKGLEADDIGFSRKDSQMIYIHGGYQFVADRVENDKDNERDRWEREYDS